MTRRHFHNIRAAARYLMWHGFELTGAPSRWRKCDEAGTLLAQADILLWGTQAVIVIRPPP